MDSFFELLMDILKRQMVVAWTVRWGTESSQISSKIS